MLHRGIKTRYSYGQANSIRISIFRVIACLYRAVGLNSSDIAY